MIEADSIAGCEVDGQLSLSHVSRAAGFGRKGFAEVAQLAQVPIVPLFTRNIRELFLVMGSNTPLIAALYKLTKFPFTPFIGPVPLPLTTVLGTSPPFDVTKTATQVASDAQAAMRRLIEMSIER